ncbi:hypothetical protein, partial [Enterobacter sp. UNJFSC 003]|uniref:hypothetical protein n=1 Tax=Enterobacter sp. UNJFSC 003 TaxID=3122077 RepID=UPI002EA7E5A1|nr:hypothetical protein [Serratia liquefaciens]
MEHGGLELGTVGQANEGGVNQKILAAAEAPEIEARTRIPPLIQLVADDELAIGDELPGKADVSRQVCDVAELVLV